jgi:hypothetical protein
MRAVFGRPAAPGSPGSGTGAQRQLADRFFVALSRPALDFHDGDG